MDDVMRKVHWMGHVLMCEGFAIGELYESSQGDWCVNLCREEAAEDDRTVSDLPFPTAKRLIGAWCFALTGKELPEENAPW